MGTLMSADELGAVPLGMVGAEPPDALLGTETSTELEGVEVDGADVEGEELEGTELDDGSVPPDGVDVDVSSCCSVGS